MSQNPYEPPSLVSRSDSVTAPTFALGLSIVPAIISAALNLVVWVGISSAFGPPSSILMDQVNWSISLLLSVAISASLVNYFWPTRTYPFAFGGVYSVLSFAYALLLDNRPNGTDHLQSLIAYSTLAATPLLVSAVTYVIARGSKPHSRPLPRTSSYRG